MADANDNIPTLTDIAHPGDAQMLNHFDAHQFNIDSDEVTPEIKSESIEFNSDFSISVPPETEDEITITEEHVEFKILDEVPSIKINSDENIDNTIENEDFSEAMQIEEKIAADEKASLEANTPFSNTQLKEKIDQAISEALPGIEAQLKGKLYSKFGI